MNTQEKIIKELKNWKEISKGYYRFVIAPNVACEIFIEYWEHDTPIETAKAYLCIVGDWHTKDRKSITEREWIGKKLPIQELLEIAYKDVKKIINNTEKINIVELLKGCPIGMELDCLMYDNVTFVSASSMHTDYPIRIRTASGFETSLTKYGQNVKNEDAKCVIFPKGKTTWEGFVPPCEFKDGDIVATKNGLFIGIVKLKNNTQVKAYCAIDGYSSFEKDINYKFERFATKEEKEKLFNAIKANGYRWNAETKTLEKLIEPKFKVGDRIKSVMSSSYYTVVDIKNNNYFIKSDTEKYPYQVSFENEINYKLAPDKFDINTLVPFESRVLVRDTDDNLWLPAIYGVSHSNGYSVVGGVYWKQCIPYEGNEHLFGKTDDCAEYYKTWE